MSFFFFFFFFGRPKILEFGENAGGGKRAFSGTLSKGWESLVSEKNHPGRRFTNSPVVSPCGGYTDYR